MLKKVPDVLSEGLPYIELQVEEHDAVAREVTSADMASSDGGSSDGGKDDGDFVPVMVSGDENEGKTEIAIKIKSWPAT